MALDLLTPFLPKGDTPWAPHVRACMTTRHGGVSRPPWDALNLGDHVGDDPQHVRANREHLTQAMGARPVFMTQVHGVQVLELTEHTPDGVQADACFTQQAGIACTAMVADCLPVLLWDADGHWVAAAHAGWRGLAGQNGWGVLESLWQSLQGLGADASQVQAWLGPCIGPQAFEVGAEVREAFVQASGMPQQLFMPQANGRFMADLAGLARWRLQGMGIDSVHGNDGAPVWCTVSQPSTFFSHRRDSRLLGSTGRMTACIWLER